MHRLADADLPLQYVTEESPDADFDDVEPDAAEVDLRISPTTVPALGR